VLITNLGIASWWKCSFDVPSVAAMSDRVFHRSVVVNIDGQLPHAGSPGRVENIGKRVTPRQADSATTHLGGHWEFSAERAEFPRSAAGRKGMAKNSLSPMLERVFVEGHGASGQTIQGDVTPDSTLNHRASQASCDPIEELLRGERRVPNEANANSGESPWQTTLSIRCDDHLPYECDRSSSGERSHRTRTNGGNSI
jgi:hypothetical protein